MMMCSADPTARVYETGYALQTRLLSMMWPHLTSHRLR